MTGIWNELENIRGTFTNSTHITPKELLGLMLDQHKKVLEERDAMAANVERWRAAYTKLSSAETMMDSDTQEFVYLADMPLMTEFDTIADESPASTLARRDARMKAEALEYAADNIAPVFRKELRAKAAEYRQQAQGETHD